MEEQAMRLGATAYLRKPFEEVALLGAVRIAMKSQFNRKRDEKEYDSRQS
jgi:FixJ family two-component response regulator